MRRLTQPTYIDSVSREINLFWQNHPTEKFYEEKHFFVQKLIFILKEYVSKMYIMRKCNSCKGMNFCACPLVKYFTFTINQRHVVSIVNIGGNILYIINKHTPAD